MLSFMRCRLEGMFVLATTNTQRATLGAVDEDPPWEGSSLTLGRFADCWVHGAYLDVCMVLVRQCDIGCANVAVWWLLECNASHHRGVGVRIGGHNAKQRCG